VHERTENPSREPGASAMEMPVTSEMDCIDSIKFDQYAEQIIKMAG
jgi:hypothetical protein